MANTRAPQVNDRFFISANSGGTQKLALKIDEVVEASSLGRATIYRAIKAGKLRTRKFGSRTIVLREDLEAFLRALPFSDEIAGRS
jgi:excisionase family DNA binding protein